MTEDKPKGTPKNKSRHAPLAIAFVIILGVIYVCGIVYLCKLAYKSERETAYDAYRTEHAKKEGQVSEVGHTARLDFKGIGYYAYDKGEPHYLSSLRSLLQVRIDVRTKGECKTAPTFSPNVRFFAYGLDIGGSILAPQSRGFGFSYCTFLNERDSSAWGEQSDLYIAQFIRIHGYKEKCYCIDYGASFSEMETRRQGVFFRHGIACYALEVPRRPGWGREGYIFRIEEPAERGGEAH